MSERAPQIVLVRHGETEWSAADRHTGRSDVPLTDRGRRQAEALAAALGGRRFARVLTSPLRRAADTAALAGFADAERRDDLVEWDYGDYEGRTKEEIRRDVPGWTLWDVGVPGGETLAEVGARVDRALAELREADADVAVFAHGHVLRIMVARWCGMHARQAAHFRLHTATLSALGWKDGVPVVDAWNLRP
jgi:probable phosphoglycerate mutase